MPLYYFFSMGYVLTAAGENINLAERKTSEMKGIGTMSSFLVYDGKEWFLAIF